MKNVLIISPQSWGKMFISKHHYAIELSKMGYDVYYMNPPNRNIHLKNYSIEKLNEHNNLFLINYYLPKNKVIDFLRFRCNLTQYYDWLLLNLINRICKENLLKFEYVWNFDPNLHGFLSKYPAKKKIFFTADIISNSIQTRSAKNIDAVVSVADELLKKFSNVNNNLLLINHGISNEYQQFAQANLSKLNNRNINITNKRIQIGYIGNLLITCLYFDGLKKIIEENPFIDFHFWGAYNYKDNNVMGGENESLVHRLEELNNNFSNTHFYGVKTANEIIPELSKIDAFIYINDSRKDLNGGANSHKILEYLSTGKVVISTQLSYYKSLNLFPMLEKGNEDEYPIFFKNIITQLTEYNNVENQRNRIEFALQNSYKNNIQKIFDYIN